MRNKAKTRLTILAIIMAVLVITALYYVTQNRISANRYNAAVSLMEIGEYEAAIPALEAMDGYKDSAELIETCKTATLDGQYAAAVSLMESGEYEAAIPALEAMDGYKDSAEQIERCRTAILDRAYAAAVELMDREDYERAIAAFAAMNSYQDSEALMERCEAMIEASKVNVGDLFTFGHFEQDNDTSNGKEAIEWLVLAKEENRIYVISKYALMARGYNDVNAEITWETCTLRAWLNGEFLEETFTAEEQAKILTVTVPPAESPKYNTDPGNATEDKLFLISIAELNEFFPTDSERECKPTAYAIANGAEVKEINGNCWWWLRSPGISRNCAARVNCYGSLRNSGPPVSSYYSCVRPAMWIDLLP